MTVFQSALRFSTCVLVLSAAVPAAAFEFSGAELALTYSQQTDNSEFSTGTLEGRVEFDFTRNFAVQLDAARYDFGFASDADISNVTLHSIYHINDRFSAGTFYGTESLEENDLTISGLELGAKFNAVDLQAYAASVEDDGDTGGLYGIEARYTFENGLFIEASYDQADLGRELEATNVAGRAGYAFTDVVTGTFEFGNADYERNSFAASEPYVGIGVTFEFGEKRGVSFGERSLGRALPAL